MASQGNHRRHRRETAGHLAVTRVPTADERKTVGEVRQLIRQKAFEAVDLVIVTRGDGRYAGVVPVQRLLEADDAVAMAEITDAGWPTIAPSTDQEHAVAVALATPAVALAVVNGNGEPLGLLPARVLFEVLHAEHQEDSDRLVGILRERSGARHALEDPPLRRFGRRMPWLLVGLVMSSAATAVMAGFEHTLQKHVMVAFFIPAIVYLTDAIGTQTEAVAVRGLSARHRPLGEILWYELLTGGLIGAALGIVATLAIWASFGNFALGLGVGLSLAVGGTIACGIGLMLPWLLSRVGVDPAYGAGPVATIVQDVLTIIVYFWVMTRVVGLTG